MCRLAGTIILIDYGLLGALEQEVRRLGLRPPEMEYGERVTLTALVSADDVAPFQARVRDLSSGQAEALAEGMVFAE